VVRKAAQQGVQRCPADTHVAYLDWTPLSNNVPIFLLVRNDCLSSSSEFLLLGKTSQSSLATWWKVMCNEGQFDNASRLSSLDGAPTIQLV
jgi:hypothetical protein